MNDFKLCPGSGGDGASAGYRGMKPCPECGAKFAVADELASRMFPAHAKRHEPSSRYYPRAADMNDPFLCGCANSSFTEEQVIDVMARRCRELQSQVMKLMEFQPPAPIIIRREDWPVR